MLIVPLVGLLVRAPWGALGGILAARRSWTRSGSRCSVPASRRSSRCCWACHWRGSWRARRCRGLRLLRALVTLPLVLPPVVGGVALLLVLGRNGLVGQYLDLWFGITLPFTTARRGRGRDVRRDAVPGDRRGGRLPLRGPGVRRGSGHARSRPADGLPAGDAALDPAGAGGRIGAVLGPRARRVRRHGHLRRQPAGRDATMPLAVYLAMETDPDAAIALSLVLLAVSVAVLFALRGRWLGQRWRGVSDSAATFGDLRADGLLRRPRRPAVTFDARRRLHGRGPGEVLGVLGPNGAGKSTLLRAVAGLASSARARIGVGAARPGRRRTGHVRARRAASGRVWSSRTTASSRTSTCATTSRSRPGPRAPGAAPPAAPTRSSGSSGSASPSSRDRRPAPALRRPGAAGRPGPGAGRRARRAAARRADGRAGRRGPDRRTRVPARATSPTSPGPVAAGHPRPARGDGPGRPARSWSRHGGWSRRARPRRSPGGPPSSYVARLVGLNLVGRERSTDAAGTVALEGGGRLAVAPPATRPDRCWSPCGPARSRCTPSVRSTPATRNVWAGAGRRDGGARRPGPAAGRGRARRPWSTSRRRPWPSSASTSACRSGSRPRPPRSRRTPIARLRDSGPPDEAPSAFTCKIWRNLSDSENRVRPPEVRCKEECLNDAHAVSPRTAHDVPQPWPRSSTPVSPTTRCTTPCVAAPSSSSTAATTPR